MKGYSLMGVDGNAHSLMGYTASAMKHCGFPKEDIDKMYKEATSGDYNNLVGVCDSWVTKCNEKLGM